MSSLHERWMGGEGPTDVLAFPMDELDTARPDDPEPGPALLGDVVLCPAVAVRQARAAGHSHGRRTGAARHARRAAPARLRPHGARRGAGDVRAPAEAHRRAGGPAPTGEPVTGEPADGDRSPMSPDDHPARGRDLLVPLAGVFGRDGRRAAAGVQGARRGDAPRAASRRGRALSRSSPSAPGTSACCCCCGSSARLLAAVLVAPSLFDAGAAAGRRCSRAGVMVVVSYVLVGVGPRTLGRQHAYGVGAGDAPASCGCSAGCSARWPRC